MLDPDGGATDGLALSRRTMLKGVAGGGVFAAAGSALADATADVVVRAESVDVPLLLLDADPVDALKATAAESQQPVVDYVERTDGLTVKNRFWLANALLVGVDTGTVDLDRLAARQGVERVHPNHEFRLPEPDAAAGAAADGDATFGLDQIAAPAAWDAFGTRGDGAKVAVLDTGVDVSHPDLELFTEDPADPTFPGGWAEFDSDGAQVEGSEPRDTGFHGSHVSGTVAGGDASGTRIGVAPEADLMHGLAIPGGSGSFAQIVGAMQWAVDNGADAINMSLGATGFFGEFVEPVRNAGRAGTVVVCSAGNSGDGSSSTPGNVLESLAVGATDESRDVAGFSSGEAVETADDWGPVAPDDWPAAYVVPDVAAPGVAVTSSVPADADFDDRWTELSGTSMASPHVAGLVALMESAAVEPFDPGQLRAAVATTAGKPADAPDGRDTRYGSGVVDAVEATGRVAADGGVTGTVTDADGTPVPGATVTLSGFPDETGGDGRYRLRATPGEYELTAEAFGHATRRTTVEVPDGFVTRDFALGDALAVEVVDGQPEGVEAGDSFAVEVRVANLEALTVDRRGDYDGDLALTVDGREVAVGERVPFDDPLDGTVTVGVETGPDGTGDLSLALDIEGLGETVQVTTGPTSVFEGPVAVGVVDVAEGGFGSDVAALLDAALPPRFQPEVVAAPDLLDAVEADSYDAYVVQSFGDDEALPAAFAAATRLPGTGVVYLDQFGADSEAISQLSAATGDPDLVRDAFVEAPTPVPVTYSATAEHPVLDGLPDFVELYTPAPILFFSGFHTFFEEYDGEFDAATLAEVGAGGLASGDGLAVDDLGRTVLASSLGLSVLVTRSDLTDDAGALLANAVAFAADTPPVVLLDGQARRVDPGGSTSVLAAVEDLERLTVDLAGSSTLAPGELTLTVDGEAVGFGEPVAFDEPVTDDLRIAVETADDAVGLVALDLAFVTREPEGSTTTAVTTGPTSVYAPPLSVPGDVARINDAVALAVPDEEILVADGTYREENPDGFQTGVLVDTPGVTLRAADGADPLVLAAEDLFVANVVNVDADDVTVEGLTVNLRDGETDTLGQGIRVNAGVSGTTVREVTAGGTTGVFLDRNVSDVRVEDATAVDTPIGVGTDFFGGPVDGLAVTGLTLAEPNDVFGLGGVYVENATRVEVTGCDLTFGEVYDAGVLVFGPFGGGEDSVVRNNRITGPDLDVEDPLFPGHGVFLDSVATVVEGNEIQGAHTGVRVGDFGFGDQPVTVRDNSIADATNGLRLFGDFVAFEENAVEAAVGVSYDGGFFGIDANAAKVRFNDLSGADLPFAGEPAGFGGPPGPFDARLNYLGDRGYDDPIVDGEVAYDPFLTAPPGEVDLDAPTAIGTDLYLDPGEQYALGLPGASDRTLWELLGEEHPDFDGTVEFWNADAGRFQDVTGTGRLEQLDALDAFRVTPGSGVRAVLDFRLDDGTPPGLRDDAPGETRVQAGWNFVCAPAYGDDGVFEGGTAEIAAVEARGLTPPRSQLGPDDAARSAFTGYFVRASSAGTIAAGLDAYGPTMTALYGSLGLDPVIHDSLGPGAAPASAGALPSVGAVLDAVPDEEAADALAGVLGAAVAAALADAGADAARADVVEGTLRGETAAAPSHDAVRAATRRVLQLALGGELHDPDGEDVTRTAAAAAGASEESPSRLGGALPSLFGD